MNSDQNFQSDRNSSGSSFGWYGIVITLTVIVVVGAAMLIAGGNNGNVNDMGDQNQQNTVSTDDVNQGDANKATNTDRSASQPAVADESDLSVATDQFPDGLIRPEDTVIETMDREDSGELIAVIESDGPLDDAFDYYSGWFEDEDYQINRSSIANGLLVATNNSSNIAVAISEPNAETTQIRITYLPR